MRPDIIVVGIAIGLGLLINHLLNSGSEDQKIKKVDKSDKFKGQPDRSLLGRMKKSTINTIEKGNYSEVYVGRASDVDARIRQHEQDKGKFELAVILYKTDSLENAQIVERELIEYLRNQDVEVLNDASDSRGSSGKSPYYIYILLRK